MCWWKQYSRKLKSRNIGFIGFVSGCRFSFSANARFSVFMKKKSVFSVSHNWPLYFVRFVSKCRSCDIILENRFFQFRFIPVHIYLRMRQGLGTSSFGNCKLLILGKQSYNCWRGLLLPFPHSKQLHWFLESSKSFPLKNVFVKL